MNARKHREYFVYSYQYNDMKRGRVDARRIERESGSTHTIDTLPPTVKQLHRVYANNKREAIAKAGIVI